MNIITSFRFQLNIIFIKRSHVDFTSRRRVMLKLMKSNHKLIFTYQFSKETNFDLQLINIDIILFATDLTRFPFLQYCNNFCFT